MNRILAAPVMHGGAAIAVTVILLAWVLVAYGRTTAAMVSVWARSDTFAHGFVIVPLFLFLLWREREKLASIKPTFVLSALLGVAAAGGIWFAAMRLGVLSVAQFAMVAMIPLGVWAVLGTAALKALWFPLCFLFFAVPFGEFMLPTLIDWTADVTITALRLSGIPVYREGNFFMIPSGRWSVVEACSGLRYLIASVVVGSLFAYLSFRSPARRAAFVAVSIAVPLVANWIRAYAIVMLGHLSDNRIATGVDHLVYGWVFFGAVMAVMFVIGARWREESAAPGVVALTTAAGGQPGRVAAIPRNALLSVLALTAIWPVADALQGDERNAASVVLQPVQGRQGWMEVVDAAPAWRPDITGARAELTQIFVKDGVRVGLHVSFYREQGAEARAITSQNQIVRSSNTQWLQLGASSITAEVAGQPFGVRTAVVAFERERLAVWQWFWVAGKQTASAYVAKLYEIWAVLQGRGDAVAWVVIYTDTASGDEASARALQAFAADMQQPLDAALQQAAGAR